MRIARSFTASLALALCACAPEPLPQTWKPVNANDLIAELQAPTGTFEGDALEDLVAELEDLLGPMLDSQRVFDKLLQVAQDLSDADSTDGGVGDAGMEPLRTKAPPGESRGTKFFLKVSCPGPDGGDVDFGHGSLRIDSPTIEDLKSETLGQSGDFLLSYDDCQSLLGTINGRSPGYYDVNRETFLLDYQVKFTERDNGETYVYDGPLYYVGGLLEILLGAPDESFRVSFDPLPATTLEIAGESQSVMCQYDPSDFSIGCE